MSDKQSNSGNSLKNSNYSREQKSSETEIKLLKLNRHIYHILQKLGGVGSK